MIILTNLNIAIWSTTLLIVCRVLNIIWAIWFFCRSLDGLLDFVFVLYILYDFSYLAWSSDLFEQFYGDISLELYIALIFHPTYQ